MIELQTMPRLRVARPSGQTLVEVLVATIVLGVGLMAVMRGFSVCTGVVSIVRSQTIARGWAQNKAAQLRLNPSLLTSDESGDLGPEHPGFAWRRQVREYPGGGVVAVRIEVSWKNRGVSRQYVLETLVPVPRS